MKKIELVKDGCGMPIYLDQNSADYKGLSLIAETFSEDIKAVTGVKPPVITEKQETPVLIAGSIGNCGWIDEMIEDGTLDVRDIKDKFEVFKICEADGNLVVVGSMRIAVIFGIFAISEKIGVSPWIYWGDVKPKKKKEITLKKKEICFTSQEPSVRYRGFFMNDEWPSLGNFVMKTFGDFNAEFYRKVFELLLRLKGNYFWPAMWSASFPLDGGSGNPLANVELADAFGLTACLSHHEPMTRSSEEWDKVKSEKNGAGYGADWNYYTNKEGLYQYWSDGMERGRNWKNMIVIGMRGERDTSMLGEQSTVQENVDLLRDIISDQKGIIKDKDAENMPQMLALYKEVEDYYYGTENTKGLKDWEALDNVTLLISDDNFGNVRRLPVKENKDRKAGWGLYYHFDYHGGPISYEWVSSMPLQKTWEQVSMAYDYGIRDIWIVNVGDLRPQEVPLSYFMQLAYDFENWGTGNINKTKEFLDRWVKQQFGAYLSDKKIRKNIRKVISGYAKMHGSSKPEATFPKTYHVTHFNEAKRKLSEFKALEKRAKKLLVDIPEEISDAFYGMVYYPAVAGVNLQKANIYAALNQWYAANGAAGPANEYREKAEKCIRIDEEMMNHYHYGMADGKWEGMMLSKHFCFESWNDEKWHYPETVPCEAAERMRMLVHAENQEDMISGGTTKLPEFNNISDRTYHMEIINGGSEPITYELSCGESWLRVSKAKGTVKTAEEIRVWVDWYGISESRHGKLVINSTGQTAEVEVSAKVINREALPEGTFIMDDGIISIEAEHFSKSSALKESRWERIKDYGKTLSSMKVYPTTVNFDEIGKAPGLTYRVMIEEDGKYILRGITAPTNNLESGRGMRYAVAVDGGEPIAADTLIKDFIVGTGYGKRNWSEGVLRNAHYAETAFVLTKGVHEFTVYPVDAGIVLQKFVLYTGVLPGSFFGPEESGRV